MMLYLEVHFGNAPLEKAKADLFFEDRNISANMKLKSGYYFYCVVKLTLHKL